RARAAGGDERHVADLPHRPQLLDVVSAAYAVAAHAVEHDLAGAALLDLAHPGEDIAAGFARALRIAAELVGAIAVARELAVDTDDDALGAETAAQCPDQAGIGQRGRVDRHFFRARIEDFLGFGHGADAARDAERNVEHPRHPPYPAAVHGAPLR